MPQFQPDQVTFKDAVGYGYWDDAHAREHMQFVQVLIGQTPPIEVPNFDFLSMLTSHEASKQIQELHETVHELLRTITCVAGTDYTQYDLSNEGDFYSFTQYHASEHSQIRQALGIV